MRFRETVSWSRSGFDPQNDRHFSETFPHGKCLAFVDNAQSAAIDYIPTKLDPNSRTVTHFESFNKKHHLVLGTALT